MAVQWRSCSAAPASMDRWCHRLPQPFRASSPPAPRRPRRIGCVSVPRELAAATAAAEALPEVEAAAMEEEGVVECQGCGGAGWLLCGFCKGKKNNVKSESSPRIYRRCPTCKAAGYILCARCRVYRCITFPETSDT